MDLSTYFSEPCVPNGIEGLKVLDIGSVNGNDCWIAHEKVGEKGNLVAICASDDQLESALKNLEDQEGFENLQFTVGSAEDLDDCGLQMKSADMVISNGVMHTGENQGTILQQCYEVLHDGGEVYFADIFCDRRIPKEAKASEVAGLDKLSGVAYIEDFKRVCRDVGFTDPRVLERSVIPITDYKMKEVLGNATFYRIKWRLFKVDSLETLCEDYGQIAVYNGSCPGHESGYPLDAHHFLETGKPMLVCGNSASMVSETWLKKYFTVTGNRNVHYGLFPC